MFCVVVLLSCEVVFLNSPFSPVNGKEPRRKNSSATGSSSRIQPSQASRCGEPCRTFVLGAKSSSTPQSNAVRTNSPSARWRRCATSSARRGHRTTLPHQLLPRHVLSGQAAGGLRVQARLAPLPSARPRRLPRYHSRQCRRATSPAHLPVTERAGVREATRTAASAADEDFAHEVHSQETQLLFVRACGFTKALPCKT